MTYDEEVDALRLFTGEARATSSSLVEFPDIIVDLSTDEGTHVVSLEVLWASDYLPLGKQGYDADADTLTLGETTDDPDLITENGDIVTYWQPDRYGTDGFPDPIGVTLRHASKHLGSVKVADPPTSTEGVFT